MLERNCHWSAIHIETELVSRTLPCCNSNPFDNFRTCSTCDASSAVDWSQLPSLHIDLPMLTAVDFDRDGKTDSPL